MSTLRWANVYLIKLPDGHLNVVNMHQANAGFPTFNLRRFTNPCTTSCRRTQNESKRCIGSEPFPNVGPTSTYHALARHR